MSETTFPRNPYVIGVPLTGDVGFFGRRSVFTFVENTLEAENQNVIVLYGQRRVGKTSLLHQLVRRIEGDVLPVYFDLQGKEQQRLGQVLYSLARTVGRVINKPVPDHNSFDDSGRFFREEFLPAVYQVLNQRRLLLLFDEFDVLGDELSSAEAASETLFPYLQNLIMHERQVAFVFVVGRRIEELATHFQAIFKQAAYRRVGLLPSEDARALIVEPTRGVLTFEEGAIEAILDLTAGHPYFTQLICSETFNAMKTQHQRVVAAAEVFRLVDQAIESGHGALTWFWDGLPRAERFIMSAVAHVTDAAGLASKDGIRRILEKHRIVLTGLELTDAPDRLVEWEMLRREGPDHYRFVVELVRRWIIKFHPLESARRDVDYISQRAVRLYENARDAHTAGDLEYAAEEYRRALDANPNHSGAQLGLAQVLFELGHIEASIEEFTKAYALDEMSARDGLVRARLAQGKKLEEIGRHTQAALQYEQAISISPSDPTARRRLGLFWLDRGHAALAENGLAAVHEPYEKALSFDQGDDIAQQVKAKLTAHAKGTEDEHEYEEALMAAQALRNLLPEDESALALEIGLWTRRGDALADSGEGADAIRAYQQALELKPGDDGLEGKLEAINAEWQRLLEIDRLFNKALVAQGEGDWAVAQAGWQELIKMDVLSYKERNIATLLSEAVEATSRPKQARQRAFEHARMAQSTDEHDSAVASTPIWMPVLLTALGWAVAMAIGGFLFLDALESGEGVVIAILGAIGSLTTGLSIRLYKPSTRWSQILALSGCWMVGPFLLGLFGAEEALLFFGLLGALIVAAVGSGLVLRWVEPRLGWLQVLAIGMGWPLGWTIGAILTFGFLGEAGVSQLSVFGGVAGLIGGGTLFWQLRRAKEKRQASESEKAHSSAATDAPSSTRLIWLPVSLTALGWALGMAIGGSVIIDEQSVSHIERGFAFAGAIGGFVTGLALRKSIPSFQWKQILVLTGCWILGSYIFGYFAFVTGFSSVGGRPLWGVLITSGLGSGLVLRWAKPRFTWLQALVVAIGWTIGWGLGFEIAAWLQSEVPRDIFFESLLRRQDGSVLTTYLVWGAVVGLIGGGITHWQLGHGLQKLTRLLTEVVETIDPSQSRRQALIQKTEEHEILFPTLLISAGWAVGMLIGSYFSVDLARRDFLLYRLPSGGFGVAVAGGIGSLAVALALRKSIPLIERRQILAVATCWIVGPIIWFWFLYSGSGASGTTILGTLLGVLVIGGFGSGLALQWAAQRVTWRRVLIVALGWTIGWTVGFGLFGVFAPIDSQSFSISSFGIEFEYSTGSPGWLPTLFVLWGAAVGLVGGGVTFWQLGLARRGTSTALAHSQQQGAD